VITSTIHRVKRYNARRKVTELLRRFEGGDYSVSEELFSTAYDSLHKLAHRQRTEWSGDDTLNTTAILHESYLKLVDSVVSKWESEAQFLAVAAKAMRHVLIDHARRRRTVKRGGDVEKVSLEGLNGKAPGRLALSDDRAETLAALGDALDRLARKNEREAQVVECRFFGGMTIAETAVALNISTVTVSRDCRMAQAWLLRDMQEEPELQS